MTFVNTQVAHAALERRPGGQAVLLDVSCEGGRAGEKLVRGCQHHKGNIQ